MQYLFNRFVDWSLRQNYWHHLWLPVAASILLSEAVVCGMSLALLGHLDRGYLLTGLVTSGTVSLAVCAIIFFLVDRLRESEERYRLLVENAAIPVIVVSAEDGHVLFANERAARYFGADPDTRESPLARDFWVHPEERARYLAALKQHGRVNGYEAELRACDGETKWALLSTNVTQFRGRRALLTVFADVTLLKEQQRQLEQIAHFDILTGVPNRALLGDRMGQAMAQARRSGKQAAVCYLDLDGFKPINDTYGHDIGDRVLVEIAQRLKNSLREGDTVARLGGDEFALILSGLERADESAASLNRILAAIAAPLDIDGRALEISASIGVTYFPTDGADADILLRHADLAMYEAKEGGRNRYCVFAPKPAAPGADG